MGGHVNHCPVVFSDISVTVSQCLVALTGRYKQNGNGANNKQKTSQSAKGEKNPTLGHILTETAAV